MQIQLKLKYMMVTLLGVAVAIAPAQLSEAGSLTPPGAPSSTMKTLDQIEPRTSIANVPYTITQSGSYYLTGNFSVASGDGITIGVDDVSLDLNGFTITHTGSDDYGISITNASRVSVKNGILKGGRGGIYVDTSSHCLLTEIRPLVFPTSQQIEACLCGFQAI